MSSTSVPSRESLLDQAALLVDELQAVEPMLDRYSEVALNTRASLDDLSILQLYGVLALLDETAYQPRLAARAEGRGLEPLDVDPFVFGKDAFPEHIEPATLFQRVVAARRQTVASLEAIAAEDWDRTVAAFVLDMVRRDSDVLREIGHRLLGSVS